MAKIKFDVLVTGLLVGCALVVTALVVRREFLAPAQPGKREPSEPVFMKNWRDYLNDGFRMGSAEAPVQLIKLSEFECPFCAHLNSTLKALDRKYPDKIAVTFVHFPLPAHRFAEPAARAFECAGEQGRAAPMYDRLFENQKQFGLKPWTDIAVEAGVTDSSAFEGCMKRTELPGKIAAGKRIGEEAALQGTPTLIVNGWKLDGPLGAERLNELVKKILAGEDPFATKKKS